MKLLIDAPFNSLSLGNVTYNIVRELFKRDVELGIFPVGNTDLSAYSVAPDLGKYIENGINKRFDFLKPEIPCLKIWHLNGSENRKNKDQYLLTFYECNKPTDIELKICEAQDKTFFSSSYAKNNFANLGATKAEFVPLGFDEDFYQTNKTYLKDTVHFGLMGKFENRKHTDRIIKAWLKKYGNNNKYQLSCCINNPFFKPEDMNRILSGVCEGKNYTNINFLPYLKTNKEVNEFLNAIDVDLTGLSGGEGWNLPAFNATCLGKWSLVLNETSHKDWATEKNAILIPARGQMPAEDGGFFNKDTPFNQGTFYTWEEEEVIWMMEEGAGRAGQINTEGLDLRNKFTYSNTVDTLLSQINTA